MSDSVQPHRRQPTRLPIPGIFQARTLEWVAISFSNAWKWKVKVKLLSRIRLLATPWTAAYQAPPSMGFSMQEYLSGVPLPSHAHQYNAIELKIQHTCSRDTVNSTRPNHMPVSFLNLQLPWYHHSSEGHQKPRHHPAFPPLLPALLRPLRH